VLRLSLGTHKTEVKSMNFKSEYYLTDDQIIEKYGLNEEEAKYSLPLIRKAEDAFFSYVAGLV